jgi:hypothetical protein
MQLRLTFHFMEGTSFTFYLLSLKCIDKCMKISLTRIRGRGSKLKEMLGHDHTLTIYLKQNIVETTIMGGIRKQE